MPCLYQCQLTPTDPRDVLRHVPSPIALYTKLDAKYDQQATVVGRCPEAFGKKLQREVHLVLVKPEFP